VTISCLENSSLRGLFSKTLESSNVPNVSATVVVNAAIVVHANVAAVNVAAIVCCY
jgi:hypothetical protein